MNLDGVEVKVVVVVVLHAQVQEVDAVGEKALLDGVNTDHGGNGGDGVCLTEVLPPLLFNYPKKPSKKVNITYSN